ncbi:DUF2312 domain-containing protein [Novosphingobium gossypii]|uniref:DUF2312 domain-containing protein n=1 Tax=Novosphingobium gossypii TaxID=1604774 RepID=UPI003D243445
MSDDRLRGLVQRIQRLQAERADISKDISDVFSEAKAVGYDTRIIRQLLKRLAMRSEDRHEADEMLERYEADVGITGSSTPHVDMAPRHREPFVAPAGATSEEQLRAIISKMLELRAERVEMNAGMALELKRARSAGFDPRKIVEACMWIEKCDKHGRPQMLAAEELFQIYREIGEGPRPEPRVEGDSKLVEMFAGPAPAEKKAPTLKQRKVSDALAYAQISRKNRGLT